MFISQTEQIANPHIWSAWQSLIVDDAGNAYTAESKGLRKISGKALVARYANPFAGGAATEVLYQGTDPVIGVWRDSAGALHAAGKRYHTTASGTWTTAKPAVLGEAAGLITGFGTEAWIALREAPAILRVQGGKTQRLELPKLAGTRIISIAGTSANDVYVSVDPDDARPWKKPGLAHWNGSAWSTIAGLHGAQLARVGDTIYATGISEGGDADGDRDGVVHTLTPTSVTALVQREGNGVDFGNDLAICGALGGVYVAGLGQPPKQRFARVAGKKLEPIAETTIGHAKLIAGTDKVLWLQNGVELLCTDGREWRSVARALA